MEVKILVVIQEITPSLGLHNQCWRRSLQTRELEWNHLPSSWRAVVQNLALIYLFIYLFLSLAFFNSGSLCSSSSPMFSCRAVSCWWGLCGWGGLFAWPPLPSSSIQKPGWLCLLFPRCPSWEDHRFRCPKTGGSLILHASGRNGDVGLLPGLVPVSAGKLEKRGSAGEDTAGIH